MENNDKNHEQLAVRLADMLCRLNNGEKLNVQELASHYGVNPRTIQRDLNERFAYLPLKKEEGGYRLESFYLGKLSEQDIAPLDPSGKRYSGAVGGACSL